MAVGYQAKALAEAVEFVDEPFAFTGCFVWHEL